MMREQSLKLITRWTLATLLLFAVFGFQFAVAEELSKQEHDPQGFLESLYYVKDSTRALTLEQVLNDPTLQWTKPDSTLMNFGFENKPVWVKFKLAKNQSIEKLFFEIATPKFNTVSLWIVTDDSAHTVENHFDYNLAMPLEKRPVFSRHYVFPINPSANADKLVILRLQTNYQLRVPLYLWTVNQYQRETNTRTLFQGFYFGVVSIMALYNLSIFFYSRDKSYGSYVLFILAIAGFVATERGLSTEFIWPEHPNLDFQMILIFIALTAGFSVPFTSHFLLLKVNAPKIAFAYRYLFWLWMALAALAMFTSETWLLIVMILVIIPGGSSLFIVGMLMWRKGIPAAPFFTIAWAIFVNSALVYDIYLMGFLPISISTEYLLQFGNMIEITLLSLGLANRIKILSQEKQAADFLSKSKSDFLATMSHEIRTPMNGILGMAELLGDTNLSTQQSNYLNTILNSGQTLLTVLNDILDYSKIEAGKLELESLKFDIRSMVSEVANIFSVKAKEKSLYFNVYVSADTPFSMLGDPNRIKQVIANLINNAFKFTKSGSVKIKVSRVTPDKLLFEIEDSGIGIPQDKLHTIFEKFTQADSSTSRQFGGTGLGLSISKQFIQAMGGEICVRSEVGSGSTFWFTLPIRDEVSYAASLPLTAATTRKVLLVSPDLTLTNQLKDYAIYWHCNLNAKASLIEAQQAITEEKSVYDIIIVDQHCSDFEDSNIKRLTKIAQPEKVQFLFLLEAGAARAQLETIAPTPWFLEFPLCINRLQERINAEKSIRSGEIKPAAALPDLSALKILVVDDNHVNGLVVTGFLKKLHIHPVVVDSGQAALNTVFSAETGFDLILMDCEMPEIDGYLATQKIREWEQEQNKKRTPICAFSAHAMESNKEKCFAAGMDEFLSKPIIFEQLQAILQTFSRKGVPPRSWF